MTVSVVIPTYNGAATLPACLQSVFSQTQAPTEIIVADDCSRDNTLAVAERIVRDSPVPLRVFRLALNSGGPATPLNQAIAQATGTHIAVLEQDDEMPPDRLQMHMEAVQRFPDCHLSFGRFQLIGSPEKATDLVAYDPANQLGDIPLPPAQQQFLRLTCEVVLPQLLKKNIAISNSNLFFARVLWQRIGGFDTTVRVTADWNFMLAAAVRTPIVFINSVCLSYQYSATSLSRIGYDDTGRRESRFLHEMRLRYPAYAGAEWAKAYWSERHYAKTAFRKGHLLTAGGSFLRLVRTGALLHHLFGRTETTTQSLGA